MFTRSRVALFAALTVAMLIVGCSSGGTTTGTPAGNSPAQEGATTDGGGSADGNALVETKCTMCHSLDRVNGAIYDAETWTTTVTRMEGNGLVVTAEEKQAIIDYLTERDASR